ncbi:glycosyltransferase [Novipirellula sp. SH528]|uniref:glycosyltransferase n=1 Tax=Novipirellula sp. SH528 TaxID=3454466 RepID=UPI003FA132B8
MTTEKTQVQSTANAVRLPQARSVLFSTGCMYTDQGGTYLSLKQTVDSLSSRGHRVSVLGTAAKGQPRAVAGWAGECLAFRRSGPFSLHYAPEMRKWLIRGDEHWDLASLQSVWLHTHRVVADWCIEHDKPFMITTHGNFNQVALKIRPWRKMLARWLFMRPVLNNVSCYQASTDIEYQTLRQYGIKSPICVIGNGITIPDLHRMPAIDSLIPDALRQRRTCLYLGRLHPIKGIDRLIRAWNALKPSDDWQLVIAGAGAKEYQEELECLADLESCSNIFFTGYVSTDVKEAWFRQADFCVLPSHSEAFAMAPMEAFSFQTPVLLTQGCGFPDAARAGGAVETPSSQQGIQDGLEHMLSMSTEEHREMGACAIKFVRERFDWQVVCQQLEAVYSWMTKSGPAPKCLHFD